MSFWYDQDFQEKLVAFVCRDRHFLKRVAPMLDVEDFKPRKGQGPEAFLIAKEALKFWRDYGEPIAGLLRTYMLDVCREKHLGEKQKDKLLDLVDDIRKNHSLVAVEALERKVVEYKARRAKYEAIQKMNELQEKGVLTNDKFQQIVNDAVKPFHNDYKATDYFRTIDKRILRREAESRRRWPLLFIDPLDREIRAIPRGGMGLIVAQLKVGKSTALRHITMAYSLQGYKGLHFTLEDTKEIVEDGLDAAFTELAIKHLADVPNRLRRRFEKARERVRGGIRIIDATDGGLTVQRIEDIWERERNAGYVADYVTVDYDDEIVPTQKRDERRFEFADIYRGLRQFTARRQVFLWTAATAKRGKDNQMIVSAGDVAEDISKPRKVNFALGVGMGPPEWGSDSRHLNVAAHRHDKQFVGWNIVGDFAKGVFFDREETLKKMLEEQKQEQEEE